MTDSYICISNRDYEHVLTIGKRYFPDRIDHQFIYITSDDGFKGGFIRSRFKLDKWHTNFVPMETEDDLWAPSASTVYDTPRFNYVLRAHTPETKELVPDSEVLLERIARAKTYMEITKHHFDSSCPELRGGFCTCGLRIAQAKFRVVEKMLNGEIL